MLTMDYNGGPVVVMVGKGCVAIACDLGSGNQAPCVVSDFEKVRSFSVRALGEWVRMA
jgi:20S proteasome subunit beta 3